MASSSMIEDQELRELFAAESEEHLHQLETGLLHLEKHPDDMVVLKDLFREAHSLKGAARMLGVRDVETLAHHFEDFLGAASKGQRTFTATDVDRLTRGLDDIRALVDEAVTGKVAPIALPEALQRLTSTAEIVAPPEGKAARLSVEKAVVPPPAGETPVLPDGGAEKKAEVSAPGGGTLPPPGDIVASDGALPRTPPGALPLDPTRGMIPLDPQSSKTIE
ncbi:MAG: Hpt domain-containing protein, partial [Magnetococcales bacterium]|nr:Hpt domain-containing protein [Magnetococcales bacterium]